MRTPLLLSAALAIFVQAMPGQINLDFLNHNRPLLDAHNCYPYKGDFKDRIDRALAAALTAGYPIGIEQDLAWAIDPATGKGRPVVTHEAKTTGSEPALRDHFFERVRPIIEKALADNDRAHAILYGYQQMDMIVEKALELAGNHTIIVLSSALGQQPYLLAEEKGGKRFHRPHNLSKFAGQIRLKGVTGITPVMSEQFHIDFDSAESARTAAEHLRRSTIEGKPAFNIDYEPGGKVFLAGSAVFRPVPQNARLVMPNGDSFPFLEIFYLVNESLKSGMHHPHGILWVRGLDRQHSVTPGTIPLRSVCPTILEMFGLLPTAEMTGPPLRLNACGEPVESQAIQELR